MATLTLSVIAFLALIVWRFFTDLQRRPVVREIDAPQQQDNNFLEQGFRVSESADTAVIAGDRFENSSDGVDPIDRKDRPKTYLLRIVAALFDKWADHCGLAFKADGQVFTRAQ